MPKKPHLPWEFRQEHQRGEQCNPWDCGNVRSHDACSQSSHRLARYALEGTDQACASDFFRSAGVSFHGTADARARAMWC